MRVDFADCTFDSETRQLLRGGDAVHLSPKAFRLLELLLENRPRALSKQELQDKLWPKTFVSEANLAGLAAEARRAIGDAARGSRLLQTVYGFGYRFSGEARERKPSGPPLANRLLLDRDGEEIALEPGENLLGRDATASVLIDDGTVSRRHARITIRDGKAAIEDLGSKNGTFLNGTRLGTGPLPLAGGDQIQVGSVFLTFQVLSPDKSTQTLRGSGRHLKSLRKRRDR
jgi:DNA-binding winged helix-turn-helix (wHTH) protein